MKIKKLAFVGLLAFMSLNLICTNVSADKSEDSKAVHTTNIDKKNACYETCPKNKPKQVQKLCKDECDLEFDKKKEEGQ